MRVLFLADAVFEDLPGGSRLVAREQASGLTQRGHEVTFLVARHDSQAPDDEEHTGVRIVRYAGAGQARPYIKAGRAACRRLWSAQPFDIVHTHFAYAAQGPLGVIPPEVPRIRTFHGPWDEEGWIEDTAGPMTRASLLKARLKRRLRFHIERVNLRSSQKVLVLSDYFGKLVHNRFKVAPQHIHKIVGGVDTQRFKPALDQQAVRKLLNLPQERRLLLSIRRLAPRMGLENLIHAMPQIVARHPDTLLLIGGKGPDRARLETAISAAQLNQHIQLLGFIPEDKLVAYYQAADLFVLPTITLEGFGLVTVEALACGTPVIGTPAGATPEILTELEPRLVTKGIFPEELAEGILSFLELDWRQELTPERLHRFVCERYTWERHVDAVEAIYEETLGQAPHQL